ISRCMVLSATMTLTLMLMATGLDFWTAHGCRCLLEPAFGALSNNFQPVSDVGTWILSCAMILGRLEYFTVLALFLPSFW
ncbi:MAG: potassium transporter, partial [Gammaproteobacteria bacterium]|nr:potassium transporter [Gammaproteobacteria bacterium]